MVQNQGPATSSKGDNAKFNLIRNYVEKSGAFTYNETTGNYSMNNNDTGNLWTGPSGINVGYALSIIPIISTTELQSNQFDNGSVCVAEINVSNDNIRQSNYIYLSKMQFFDLWLGMKLTQPNSGDNPPDPDYYYAAHPVLDYLAGNFSYLMNQPKSYFDTNEKVNGTDAQHFTAMIQGEIASVTKMGFPEAKTQTHHNWWDCIVKFADSLISGFLNVIDTIWNDITTTFNSIVGFTVALWDNVVGPLLGPVMELVKQVVLIVLNTIVNVVVQPMLSGQTTSLNSLFGGETPC